MGEYDLTNAKPFKELTQTESDNIAYNQGYYDAVEKACEWLEQSLPPIIDIIGDIIDRDALIEQLCKAMEEK